MPGSTRNYPANSVAERDTALAPFEQQFHDAKRQVEGEFVEAGGMTIEDNHAPQHL